MMDGPDRVANIIDRFYQDGDADHLQARLIELDGLDLTEDGISAAFSDRYRSVLRYCHTADLWYKWDGAIWRPERTRLAFHWARLLCRELVKRTEATHRVKAMVAKAATAPAVERFAQADEALAVTYETWDSDPFLLGTPAGTVDLRTGVLRAPAQTDYITRSVACAPANAAECPTWLNFLHQATNGDVGLIRFLQQFCGYLLTGDTREHALLFIYGPGGNGKSVWLNTISAILADYCQNAAMDTFTASRTDKHPTDLAMLNGSRLVCASETEEGRAWAESRIKQMTGGDPITGRFMRRDFFYLLAPIQAGHRREL